MDLAKMLAHLRAELDNLDAAIASLQRLQQGERQRGRPPQFLKKPGDTAARRGGKAKLDSLHAGEPPPVQEA